MVFKKIFASIKIVASLPDPTAIYYGSRDGSKIIRRTIAGSAIWIFPRIRWIGERGASSSRPIDNMVLLRDATTGFLDTPVTLAFVLMIGDISIRKILILRLPERTGFLKNSW